MAIISILRFLYILGGFGLLCVTRELCCISISIATQNHLLKKGLLLTDRGTYPQLPTQPKKNCSGSN